MDPLAFCDVFNNLDESPMFSQYRSTVCRIIFSERPFGNRCVQKSVVPTPATANSSPTTPTTPTTNDLIPVAEAVLVPPEDVNYRNPLVMSEFKNEYMQTRRSLGSATVLIRGCFGRRFGGTTLEAKRERRGRRSRHNNYYYEATRSIGVSRSLISK